MLEGLDAIDWSRLTHADGHAGDLPDFIRALASDDPEARRRALGALFGNIWFEGLVYEATAYAVPFLVELLAHPDVQGKAQILRLLSCIAECRPGVEADDGIESPPPGENQALRAWLANERDWVRASRAAVEDGAATYLDRLDDEDAEVRILAAYTLGLCPGRADRIFPELVARVAAEGDPRCRAALILAAGALAEADGGPGRVGPLFAERMRPGERPVVRLSAAISAVRSSHVEPSAEILDVLCATAEPAWYDFEGLLPSSEGGGVFDVDEAIEDYPEARLRFLSGLLDSRDEAVRNSARYAAEGLAQERRAITPRVAAALGDRIATADVADRRGLIEILSRLGPSASAAAGPLAVALGDDDPDVRTHAALALAGLGDPRAVPVLIERLGERATFSRVVGALGALGAEARDAVPALVGVLRRRPSTMLDVQAHPIGAAEALGRIGPDARAAIPDLIDLMKKQPQAQRSAAEAIGRIGGPGAADAIPILNQMLRSRRDWDSISAARALWRIERRADGVLPVLTEWLWTGDERCRAMAAEALGEIGEAAREAVPDLIPCLEDRSFRGGWVRLQAAVALWRIERRADRALPVLVGLLRDPGRDACNIVTRAAETLGEIGAEAREAIPILRELEAADVRPFGHWTQYSGECVIADEALLSAVAEALRRIEGDRA